MNKILSEAINDSKKQRTEALANAKTLLEETFLKKCGADIDESECELVECEDECDLDEVIVELDKLNNPSPSLLPPTFIQSLTASFFRRKQLNGAYAMRNRFKRLAGIESDVPAAKLKIGQISVGLDEVPKWYNLLRYKICGFDVEIFDK